MRTLSRKNPQFCKDTFELFEEVQIVKQHVLQYAFEQISLETLGPRALILVSRPPSRRPSVHKILHD